VLRAVTNFALSVLLVITLLWGGCVACEQFFRAVIDAMGLMGLRA